MIQLAAFRDQNKALEIVGILTEKHKKRLESWQLETMRVDTGTNGVFHRVVSEPLPAMQRINFVRCCGALDRIVFCGNIYRLKNK